MYFKHARISFCAWEWARGRILEPCHKLKGTHQRRRRIKHKRTTEKHNIDHHKQSHCGTKNDHLRCAEVA
jgi:hypothetical protein